MSDGFYLGGVVDGATGDRVEGENISYDPADLTTHGVIVGMTGSGKTGLGVIFLEEALRAGIPTLVLDPKGDMTNLLLTFPELSPADFEPWIDEAEARREGVAVDERAAQVAQLWRNGLDSWGLGSEDIRRLRDAAGFTIYTPGSQAGVPLDIVGSLAAPGGDFDADAETLRDEIEGFVSGLLGLVGIAADPISSREHILLANLIEHAWRQGEDLDLAGLLGRIHQPPLRKLGVFDVDTFFPEKDRLALAMQLNGLIASPAFASWTEGPPLDVGRLLYGEDGKPQASIVYLAHLSDDERQFIVTLLLGKVITWMRAQAGTGDLRALVYMDEVFGFVPPTAQPPAKKPILTLLKQARAFGVGMLLSTQNPVDLDYKAMSNAGTWCIGRLQTERDKARIVEALQSARGDRDVESLDRMISGLGKRRFLLHNTHEPEPVVFGTRWAMSYLRGPLTRDQISALSAEARETLTTVPSATGRAAPASSVGVAPPPAAIGDDESVVAPEVPDGVPVRYLDAAATWAEKVGAVPGGTRLEAALAVRVHMLYDDAPAGLKHREEWEAVYSPLEERFDPAQKIDVDYDQRDFVDEPPDGAVYRLPPARIDTKTYFNEVARDVADYLYRTSVIEIFKNPALKLYSRPGESREEFAARCDRAAEEAADAEVAKLRKRLEAKLRRLEDEVETARRQVDQLSQDVSSQRQNEVLDGIGSVLGGLLGGRRSSRSVSRAASKRSQTRRTESRLRSAEDKHADKVADLQEMEAEALAEVAAVNDDWEAKGAEIEVVEVGLEKSDVDVDEVALVWVATAG